MSAIPSEEQLVQNSHLPYEAPDVSVLKSPDLNAGNHPCKAGPVNERDGRATGNDNNSAHNCYVNADSQCALTGAGVPMIGLPIVTDDVPKT